MPDDRVKVAGVWMPREEARIVEEERRRMFGRLIFGKRFLPVAWMIFLFGVSVIALTSMIRLDGPSLNLIGVLGGLYLIWTCGGIIHEYMKEVREQLRRTMNLLGRRVCLKCAYEIAKDSPYAERCPECGEPYEDSAPDG